MGTKFYKNTCRSERWRWRARQRQCWQSPHSQEVARNCCRRPSSPWPGRARRRRRGPSTRSSPTQHHPWSASSLSSSSSRNVVALSVLRSRAADRSNLCQEHTWSTRKDYILQSIKSNENYVGLTLENIWIGSDNDIDNVEAKSPIYWPKNSRMCLLIVWNVKEKTRSKGVPSYQCSRLMKLPSSLPLRSVLVTTFKYY